MRAINGAAPTISGTTVAVAPMLVPTTNRVNGINTIIKIKNGTERMMFTIVPNTALVFGAGQMPSLRVTTKITPSGMPIK